LYVGKKIAAIMLKILGTTAQNSVTQDACNPDLVYWRVVANDKHIRILRQWTSPASRFYLQCN
jgi:hypothetical protein